MKNVVERGWKETYAYKNKKKKDSNKEKTNCLTVTKSLLARWNFCASLNVSNSSFYFCRKQ